jgi:2-succinyl-6-hydroxy-2,4-cyclohexadiene-1-carboxylate synthase
VTARLVLLHGFAGGSWTFDNVIETIGRCRTVTAPTLTYHGPAGGDPLPEVDFRGEIQRLASDLVDGGAEPVDLVGYSMGGRLALGLAITHPELVKSLVLLSSRRGLDGPEEREQRRQADARWADLIEQDGLDAFFKRWWCQPIFRSLSRLSPERLEHELAQRRQHKPAGLAAALRRWGLGSQPSYAAEIRSLRVPVTLVAGELDEKFVGLSREMAAELLKVRSLVVEGAGHHLPLEAPARIARIILEETER